MIDIENLSDYGIYTWPMAEFEWQNKTEPHDTLATGLEFGINFIDTSPLYGNGRAETLVKTVIEDLDCRDSVFLSTKCGLTRKDQKNQEVVSDNLKQQVYRSMGRLGVDQIDLLQIYPSDDRDTFKQQLEQAVELRQDDITRYLGLAGRSENGHLFDNLSSRIEFEQCPSSPIDILGKTANERSENKHKIATDPLFSGLLSQKYADVDAQILDHEVKQYHPKFSNDRVEFLKSLKDISGFFIRQGRDNIPLDSITLVWLRQYDDFDSILVGARCSEDVHNMHLAQQVNLSDEEIIKFRNNLNQLIEQNGLPEFVYPPPIVPRHNFERHVLDT